MTALKKRDWREGRWKATTVTSLLSNVSCFGDTVIHDVNVTHRKKKNNTGTNLQSERSPFPVVSLQIHDSFRVWDCVIQKRKWRHGGHFSPRQLFQSATYSSTEALIICGVSDPGESLIDQTQRLTVFLQNLSANLQRMYSDFCRSMTQSTSHTSLLAAITLLDPHRM